ncbi:MAG: hypothetical protein ACR2OD_06595, partial [Gaiellaceae bacterium]
MFAGSMTAAVQPVSPAPKATVKTTKPVFKWTIPAGEEARAIAVSPKAAVDADGMFVDTEDFETLDAGATSHSVSLLLKAGKHWWSVKSSIPSPFQTFWSAPQVFTVKPKVSIRKAKIRRFTAIDRASITINWTGNLKPATVKIRILNGKKKLFSAKAKNAFAFLDKKNSAFFTWKSRGRVAQGTKVKLEIKVTGAGKTFKRVVTFKAP